MLNNKNDLKFLMAPIQNMKILIIDDNPTLVTVFANLLRTKGFSVTTESTLKAGLQNLENESYNAVFVDAPLDNYSGERILAMLKENHIFKKTNVFLFSGIDVFELDKWKKYGLYSYLKKPVKYSIILKVLDDIRMKIISADSQITPEIIIAE